MPRPSKRKNTTPNDPRPKRGQTVVNTASCSSSNNTVVAYDASEQASICSSNMSVEDTHIKGLIFEADNSGKMRNLIIVHIVKRNGVDMKTNVTHSFAFNHVFRQLGVPRSKLNSVGMNWKGHPVIEYRLKDKVDIDSLQKSFKFRSPDTEGDSVQMIEFECETEGVRGPDYVPAQNVREDEDPDEPWTRWVTIEGAGYCQKENILNAWLERFGEKLTDLEEETLEMIDDNPQVGEDPVFKLGNGNFKLKMKIHEHIPQFLPIDGRKVKIYYRGIIKTCTNCYETGHLRKDCENVQTSWTEHVANFIESSPEIDKKLFGKWVKIAQKWRTQPRNYAPPTRAQVSQQGKN